MKGVSESQAEALRALAAAGEGLHEPSLIQASFVTANTWNRLVGRGWATAAKGAGPTRYALTPEGASAARSLSEA